MCGALLLQTNGNRYKCIALCPNNYAIDYNIQLDLV